MIPFPFQAGQLGLTAGSATGGGGGGGGDPYFANVVSLLHFDGTNGSTTITDVKGKTWNAAGSAQLDTGILKFGSASVVLDGTGDYVLPNTSADFTLGTGDFTIDLWIRASSLAKAVSGIVDWRPLSTQGLYPLIYVNSAGSVRYYVDSADRITSADGAMVANTWHLISLARVSGTTRLFVDGNQVGSDYTDSNDYIGTDCVVGHLGFERSSIFGVTGNLDDFRLTKGVGRYTSSFTPPAAAFPDS